MKMHEPGQGRRANVPCIRMEIMPGGDLMCIFNHSGTDDHSFTPGFTFNAYGGCGHCVQNDAGPLFLTLFQNIYCNHKHAGTP